MTDRSAIPADEMLDLLEPTVALGLERHLSAATEWFPQGVLSYHLAKSHRRPPCPRCPRAPVPPPPPP